MSQTSLMCTETTRSSTVFVFIRFVSLSSQRSYWFVWRVCLCSWLRGLKFHRRAIHIHSHRNHWGYDYPFVWCLLERKTRFYPLITTMDITELAAGNETIDEEEERTEQNKCISHMRLLSFTFLDYWLTCWRKRFNQKNQGAKFVSFIPLEGHNMNGLCLL